MKRAKTLAIAAVLVLALAGTLIGCSKSDTSAASNDETSISQASEGTAGTSGSWKGQDSAPVTSDPSAPDTGKASGKNPTSAGSPSGSPKSGTAKSKSSSTSPSSSSSKKSNSKKPTGGSKEKSASGSTKSKSGSSSGGSTKPKEDSNTITVTISIDSSAASNEVSLGGRAVTLSKGSSVYDALKKSGVTVGAKAGPMGTYVYAINSLAEKQYGADSGWIFYVNGSSPGKSCSKCTLSDGDCVTWKYKK